MAGTNGKSKKIDIPRGITPIGLVEVAVLLDVPRCTVDKWQQRGVLPEVRWVVGGRPAWNLPDIMRWARDTDRIPAKGFGKLS